MASKTFTLGDNAESGSGSCSKICMFICCLLIVGVVTFVGIYAYKSNFGGSVCDVPVLDENGLSNWTYGAEIIAYACFPGYFLEGHTNLMLATCEEHKWVPAPPACNFLPLRLDCGVNYKGMRGNITMWQETEADSTFIYGLVDYEDAIRNEGHLLDIVYISKASCEISNNVKNATGIYPTELPQDNIIKIQFNSTKLKAYNKAEVHINLIFVDQNTTATLVSVHQDDITLVMPNSFPITRMTKKYISNMSVNEQQTVSHNTEHEYSGM